MTRTVRLIATLLLVWGTTAANAQSDDRSITKIAGDLYRFQNRAHYSVFLVTPAGILVTDPINADAAKWLKAELANRFPGVPIRYLVYSHSHADHISGGEVFADTATVVSQERAKQRIVAEQVPTAIPQVTFSDRKTLELGGRQVELIYLGPSHSDNLIAMRFPAERTVFAVDIVAVKRLPYQDFPDADLNGLIAGLKTIEALDFDILAPGHGVLGGKADVADHRRYLETLRDRVKAGIADGKSVEDLKQTVTMPEYATWGMYKDWREPNVAGMYRLLQSSR
ncbi:MAG TPA: MBL fold metallo-hydrolase [Burkholderiales bacterium]|nr:MBL fold metallo-hydrolase [Burkholderiales bacterium]